MIPQDKLDFWVKNNLNVLLMGAAGVGKTHIICQTFQRHGFNFLYFSGATLDPWVDFIGIPKEINENGVKYIDIIPPKKFAFDEVDAIFIDEFNRCPAKVRNGCLELIQFKSLNGKKFNRLKMVWAAINPEDKDESEEFVYDVERLDPAQKDRFHVIYNIDYKPDPKFFHEKFPEYAISALDWWNDLDDKQKKVVSPRRLDYALEIFQLGGDIRDVLPRVVNVAKLISELSTGSFRSRLDDFVQKNDLIGAQKFLFNESNYSNCVGKIKESDRFIDFFVPLLPDEKFVSILDEKVAKRIAYRKDIFESRVEKIISTDPKQNTKFINSIRESWKGNFSTINIAKTDFGRLSNLVYKKNKNANLNELEALSRESREKSVDRTNYCLAIRNYVEKNDISALSPEAFNKYILIPLNEIVDRTDRITTLKNGYTEYFLRCLKFYYNTLGVNRFDYQGHFLKLVETAANNYGVTIVKY
jgi:hypothetical protein